MGKTLHRLPLVTSRVKSPDDAVRVLNRLQPALQLLGKAVDYGPVPGAYFPFTFDLDAIEGTMLYETELTVALTIGAVSHVVVDSAFGSMPTVGTLLIKLDTGIIRSQTYTNRVLKTYTLSALADYTDPDDASIGQPVWVDWTTITNPLLAGTAKDGQLSLVEFQPIALTIWLDSGDITIDINADGTSILTAPLSSSSSSASLTSKGDFVAAKVPRGATLTLDVDSIDAGAPTKVRVVLWASQLGDIFDA